MVVYDCTWVDRQTQIDRRSGRVALVAQGTNGRMPGWETWWGQLDDPVADWRDFVLDLANGTRSVPCLRMPPFSTRIMHASSTHCRTFCRPTSRATVQTSPEWWAVSFLKISPGSGCRHVSAMSYTGGECRPLAGLIGSNRSEEGGLEPGGSAWDPHMGRDIPLTTIGG